MLLIMDARAVRPYKVIGTGSSTPHIETPRHILPWVNKFVYRKEVTAQYISGKWQLTNISVKNLQNILWN
ncbi:MAG: hypothetical protein HDS67_10360 [Bacteroidales bacterium]|nr:hypothetical protein [Bacteroidales bacterium]